MRRLGLFWSGLPLASKLQFLVLGLILGSVFVNRDLQRQWFGLPLWKITVPLILGTFVLGRILLPVMLWHPERTQRVLYWLGMTVFCIGLYSATQRWGRLMLTHVGLTTAMWLDASCWFWFISEIQARVVAMLATQGQGLDDENSEVVEEETGR